MDVPSFYLFFVLQYDSGGAQIADVTKQHPLVNLALANYGFDGKINGFVQMTYFPHMYSKAAHIE